MNDIKINVLSENSHYVESCIEHIFLAKVLTALWRRNHRKKLQISSSEIDDFGYDVILTLGTVTRHIQLKQSHSGAKASFVKVHSLLGNVPSGCVIWVFFTLNTLDISHYLFFGGEPGQSIPELSDLASATHTKRDATGKQSIRPAIRKIPKSKFTKINSTDELIDKLFRHQGD
jgi:hypothetical protein